MADPFAALNQACIAAFGTAVSYQQGTAAPFSVKGIVMKDSDEDCVTMFEVTNGILTAVGKCAVDGICQ
jgi:hypothetical protein